MASKNIVKVILRSTESAFFYVTKRNRKAEKLALRKFDPVIRKHVEFKEEKMK